MDIKLEFLIGMILQLAGLVLLAFHFGRRMTKDSKSSAGAWLVSIGSILALLGTGLQLLAGSQ
jgi:hypothetical protein